MKNKNTTPTMKDVATEAGVSSEPYPESLTISL